MSTWKSHAIRIGLFKHLPVNTHSLINTHTTACTWIQMHFQHSTSEHTFAYKQTFMQNAYARTHTHSTPSLNGHVESWIASHRAFPSSWVKPSVSWSLPICHCSLWWSWHWHQRVTTFSHREEHLSHPPTALPIWSPTNTHACTQTHITSYPATALLLAQAIFLLTLIY